MKCLKCNTKLTYISLKIDNIPLDATYVEFREYVTKFYWCKNCGSLTITGEGEVLSVILPKESKNELPKL